MLSKIFNFTEHKAKKNYNKLVEKMVDYHEVINPKASEKDMLINAVVAVENKRNRGQIDGLNQLIIA